MKVRYQKRKCRTNEERYFHILNKQRIRKKTEILHADFNRFVCAFYFFGGDQRLFEPFDISDDKRFLIEERFMYGGFDQIDLPVKSVIGWHYNDRYNPYDY